MKIAKERAIKLEADLLNGTFAKPPSPIGIAQAGQDYIRTLEVNERAKKTIVKYFRGRLAVLKPDWPVARRSASLLTGG